jgi:hypothetical protein
VKLLSANGDEFVFHLGKKESGSFIAVLDQYPYMPAGHQHLSKTRQESHVEAAQPLLDEALAEQRAEHRNRVQKFLADAHRFKQGPGGTELRLGRADREWLLQVLNDVRVGAWVRLGAPEEKLPPVNAETVRDFWAMEMAGLFEMQFLHALEQPGEP